MPAKHFSLDWQNHTLTCQGEFCFSTIEQVHSASMALLKPATVVKINFSQVTKCDSSALALLILWERWAQQSNTQLEVMQLPKNLLTLANAYRIEDIVKGLS